MNNVNSEKMLINQLKHIEKNLRVANELKIIELTIKLSSTPTNQLKLTIPQILSNLHDIKRDIERRNEKGE